MNINFTPGIFTPILPADPAAQASGVPDEARIKQVARAVEGMFVGQLMAEMGESTTMGASDSQDSSGSMYQDFIQQAMVQGVSSGGGLGLAKVIESSLVQEMQNKGGGQTKNQHANHNK